MATRSKLSDFEVISRLGSGSFGTVFKVKRHIDESLYVIKNVRIVELSFKEQSEAINEVQILAQLKSPFVVRYYDSFIEKDCLHIVMEFCNRGDLQNLIRKAKDKSVAGLKENVIWNISLQIMLGLYYLHKKHVLHRDLKSANVFLMKDETKSHYLVKIGDLGVAKLMDTSTALANTIVGTPYYLSPELCADMPYRDKSDCWAMGVLIYECATLQHPFEARNQCALIMKIIEAQVKIPANTVISTELRNLILWLLQKDPNLRPSVKDILNESSIRDKLAEHQFDLPEELLESRVTDILSNANFETKENMKKKGSNLQLLAQRTNPEESKTADINSNKDAAKRPPPKRENSISNKEPIRVGDGIVPVSPSSGLKGGVRRTGSTTSNMELKHDNSQQQLVQQQGLAVAGNGMGPRTTSTGVTAASPHGNNIGRAPPSFRGASPSTAGTDGAGIRGDRVRGGAIKGRVPSEKAMSRYQVRPAPITGQGSARQLSESKLSAEGEESQQQQQQQQQSKDDVSSKSSPSDEADTDSPDARSTTRRSASQYQVSAQLSSSQADAKDSSDYEEDFEEYDGDNNWDQTVAPAEDSPQFSSSQKIGAARVGIAAQEKPARRDSQDATISRNVGMKDQWEYDDADGGGDGDGADDKFADSVRYGPSASLRSGKGAAAVAPDPFHDTDGSLSISDQSSQVSYPHTGTMNGEADMWSPVWTQNRGIIDNTPPSRQRDINGTVTADIGVHMYRDTLHNAEDIYEGEEEIPRNSEISEDGGFEIENLVELIEGAKGRAMKILGKSLFWKVYELCAKHMHEDELPTDRDEAGSPANNPFVKELEEILCDEGSGSIEVACEGVFSIKLLLALESKYEAYANR